MSLGFLNNKLNNFQNYESRSKKKSNEENKDTIPINKSVLK